jgi:NAD(P)-dependent dehydrogenase (short-subunit alcohol dehydrogenase family)
MDLNGAVAIVTGGGTGIGRATCQVLAESGARAIVVNYSRSAAEAESTAEELRACGSDATAMRADVTDEAAVAEMMASTVERFGRLDVLVNNAGTTHFITYGDLNAVTDQVWDDVLAVNLKAPFRCARLAAPHLRAAHGAVVNVGSTAGLRASGSSLPYGVSKAALHHLTRGLALALAPEVRVNAIAPGTVASRWFRRHAGDDRADAVEGETAASTPLQGVASPRDCALAIKGLLLSDWVTGEVVVVDGGKHLRY